MACGESYSHVIGDVTWPLKVKLVNPIVQNSFRAQYLENSWRCCSV